MDKKTPRPKRPEGKRSDARKPGGKPYAPRKNNDRPRSFTPRDEGPREAVDTEHMVEGKNAVGEALRSGREVDKVFFATGSHATVGHLIAQARERSVPVLEVDRRKLDRMSATGAHQGIIALCAAAEYKSIDDMLELAASRGEKPLIIVCDGITDPHNLGAIIRSAEVAGAHGLIIPRRRSAGLNAACAKAAAGALEYLPIAKCANVGQAVQELSKKGLFILAADMAGQALYGVDMTLPVALIIGGEGDGLSQTAKVKADFTVSIPQKGRTPSLNASNAAAVLLWEAIRQRGLA